MTIDVFLLDDHEVVRRGLRDLLEADGTMQVVGEAGTVSDALTRIQLCDPDVAVLDVRLPDGSGIEVCRAFRERRPDLPCLMLTSFADDEALLGAVLAGASGYVLKQVRGTDLIQQVKRVAAGESLLDSRDVERVRNRMLDTEQDPRLAGLTKREREILAELAQGRTNREIAATLHLAEKTVKNYVSNLLAKMGMATRTAAAVYAARQEHGQENDNDPGAS